MSPSVQSTLIAKANTAIDRVLHEYKTPAFMCSFGKDSMVLLHLLRSRKLRLPVIFHRDPWWPEKYAFADRMIREYGLEVHDYPPVAMTLWQGEKIMAFTNHYQTGPLPGGVLKLPKNILPPEEGKRFLCGLDVLKRPVGTFNYPWDCVLIGHKNSDEDSIAGRVTLHCDIKLNAGIGPDAAFPLREWTDADIWQYTHENEVPQQTDRYDTINGVELEDKWTNSDYANVCIACCDKSKPCRSTHCPKLDCEVSYCGDRVPYDSVKLDYFGGNAP